MVKQQNCQTALVTLTLCLCLGSLIVMPLSCAVDMPVLEIPETDLDSDEFDEELFIVTIAGAAFVAQISSKPGPTNLDFQSASVSPVSPPPRHS